MSFWDVLNGAAPARALSFWDVLYGAALVLWIPAYVFGWLWIVLREPSSRSPGADLVEPKELQKERDDDADE